MKKAPQSGIFSSIPPSDVDLEGYVVGCLLLSPDRLTEAKEGLGEAGKEVFYDGKMRLIYEAMVKMQEEEIPIDLLSVDRFIKRTFRKKGYGTLMVELINKVVSTELLLHHAKELRDLYQKRATHELLLKQIDALNTGVELEQIRQGQLEHWERIKITDEETQKGMSAWDSLNTPIVQNASPIPGLLVPGRFAIMAATDGEGKTTFLLQLSLSAATGTSFLDKFSVPKPVKVLYFCGENSRSDINEKLRKQIPVLERLLGRGIEEELKKNLILVYPEEISFLLDKKQDRAVLNRYLAKYEPDIVIFDPLNDFISTEKSLNDDTIARETGKSLNRLAREFDCFPILVTHTKKEQGDDEKQKEMDRKDVKFVIERIHGSKYWTNTAVTQIAMTRWNPQKYSTVKRVYVRCKTEREEPPMLLLRGRDSLWYKEGSQEEFSKAKLRAEDLVDVLQRKGTADTVPTIFVEVAAKDLGCSQSQVWELLKLARKKKLIETVNGVLRVTEYHKRQQGQLLLRERKKST